MALASLAMTPTARAQQVQSDTEKRAHNLDLKYPGSAFTQVLKSHGRDGRYLVLVVGPFANFFDELMVLCGFFGRACALKAISSWNCNISPKHVLAMAGIFGVSFWSLGFFGLDKADSGSFS